MMILAKSLNLEYAMPFFEIALYCVQVASESRFTAEDIASSVQQIFSFIHANSSM